MQLLKSSNSSISNSNFVYSENNFGHIKQVDQDIQTDQKDPAVLQKWPSSFLVHCVPTGECACNAPVHRADDHRHKKYVTHWHYFQYQPSLGSCRLKWGNSSVFVETDPNSQFISIKHQRPQDLMKNWTISSLTKNLFVRIQ